MIILTGVKSGHRGSALAVDLVVFACLADIAQRGEDTKTPAKIVLTRHVDVVALRPVVVHAGFDAAARSNRAATLNSAIVVVESNVVFGSRQARTPVGAEG